jgi:hypothetical protein
MKTIMTREDGVIYTIETFSGVFVSNIKTIKIEMINDKTNAIRLSCHECINLKELIIPNTIQELSCFKNIINYATCTIPKVTIHYP